MKRKSPHPPQLPLKFLKCFCRSEYHSDIEGDLLELFHQRVKEKGLAKARFLLVKDVLLLFRPGIIQTPKLSNPIQYNMFKHNLKLAFRNLKKRKIYTAINIIGLVIGIVSSLLILLFVQDEFSDDDFFVDSERIFKMIGERKFPDHSEVQPKVPYSFVRIMKQGYAEVENATA